MKKLVLLVTAINIVFLFSCKKEEELTNTELLCRAPWVLSASVIDPPYFFEGVGSISDYYAILSPCWKDNLWNFDESGNYTKEDGAQKCDPADPSILENGRWTLSSNGTTMVIEPYYYYWAEYEILELTKQTLKVSSMITDTLGNNYNWTETYTHK